MTFSLAQVGVLLLLAMVVACVSWTVTHEEIFREVREKFRRLSSEGPWFLRKFCYVFTCEYCFSHYVAIALLMLTRFKLLVNDWRGYVLAFFAVVWIANQYMSLYNRLRLDIKTTNLEGEIKKSELKTKQNVEQIRKRAE
jgi:hypothetical protein